MRRFLMSWLKHTERFWDQLFLISESHKQRFATLPFLNDLESRDQPGESFFSVKVDDIGIVHPSLYDTAENYPNETFQELPWTQFASDSNEVENEFIPLENDSYSLSKAISEERVEYFQSTTISNVMDLNDDLFKQEVSPISFVFADTLTSQASVSSAVTTNSDSALAGLLQVGVSATLLGNATEELSENSSSQLILSPSYSTSGTTVQVQSTGQSQVQSTGQSYVDVSQQITPPSRNQQTSAGLASVWVEPLAPSSPQSGGVGGFRIWRNGTVGNVTVSYHVSGTAVAGSDYHSLPGTVQILDGNQFADVKLDPANLTSGLAVKDVSISLISAPSIQFAGSTQATVQLGQFKSRSTVTISADTPVVRVDSPYGAAIRLTRTDINGPLVVNLSESGTSSSQDWVSLPKSVRFEPGQGQVNVWISPNANQKLDHDETLIVTAVTDGTYDVIGNPSATVTLTKTGQETAPATPGSSPQGQSDFPVRYWDGLVIYSANDLTSDGFGYQWSQTRSWYNLSTYANGSINGNGWVDSGQFYLKQDLLGTGELATEKGIMVFEQGGQDTYFSNNGSGYSPPFFVPETLSHDTTNKELDLTDANGNYFQFFDFSTSNAAYLRGQLKKVTDRYGNVTQVTSWTGSGQRGEVQRSTTVSGTTVTESYLYNYISSGANAGQLGSVTLRKQVGTGVIVYTPTSIGDGVP